MVCCNLTTWILGENSMKKESSLIKKSASFSSKSVMGS